MIKFHFQLDQIRNFHENITKQQAHYQLEQTKTHLDTFKV